MAELDDRVALVTGASSGTGAAICARLAGGAEVICADVGGAEEAAGRLGGRARSAVMDVTSAEAVEAVVASVLAESSRLDILVNCAGIDGDVRPTAELSEANLDAVIAVNLKGPFLTMRAAIPAVSPRAGLDRQHRLGVRGGGRSRIRALRGVQGGPATAHRTAMEYGPAGIRVDAICPSLIDTPALPHGGGAAARGTRRGPRQAGDPAGRGLRRWRATAFLAGDDASYVTGAVVPVDGGYLAG